MFIVHMITATSLLRLDGMTQNVSDIIAHCICIGRTFQSPDATKQVFLDLVPTPTAHTVGAQKSAHRLSVGITVSLYRFLVVGAFRMYRNGMFLAPSQGTKHHVREEVDIGMSIEMRQGSVCRLLM